MNFINNIDKSKIIKQKQIIKTYDGQIVSSKIADNDSFLLELYSFDKGEEISTQKAIYDMLFYVLKGQVNIYKDIINEKQYKVVKKEEEGGIIALEPSLVIIYSFKAENKIKNLKTNNNLEKEIDFVNNSVSSKILFQSDVLSLTLLALDQNQGLSTHAASGDALVISLDGEVEIKIDDTPYLVSDSDLIVLPAKIPHGLKAIKPYKMFLTVVKQ
ncbi:MAG: hypothetical protein EOL97_13605 [Spirochaetia bacterium]|nr:hypothetical protein [Spirochaetia bacterium]